MLYGSYKKSTSRTTSSLTSLEAHRPGATSANLGASEGTSQQRHSGRYSYQEDNSKLLLVPSALKQSRESIQRFENEFQCYIKTTIIDVISLFPGLT